MDWCLIRKGKRCQNDLEMLQIPWMTIKDLHGADATSWYLISNANPWDNLKFDPEGIAEVKRKFFGTLV